MSGHAVLTGAASAATPAALAGTWVLDDRDGSTSYYVFGATADGVAPFALFDTYATWCEDDVHARGSGSSLTATGTAAVEADQVTITVTAFRCANGDAGMKPAPMVLSAILGEDRLDFGGGFIAGRSAGSIAPEPPSPPSVTGAWLLDDGDGSTSYYFFGEQAPDGTSAFTLYDTYATWCEDDAHTRGTGSSLAALGTAAQSGTSVSITVQSFHCANGDAGVQAPPVSLSATVRPGGLDFGDGYVAVPADVVVTPATTSPPQPADAIAASGYREVLRKAEVDTRLRSALGAATSPEDAKRLLLAWARAETRAVNVLATGDPPEPVTEANAQLKRSRAQLAAALAFAAKHVPTNIKRMRMFLDRTIRRANGIRGIAQARAALRAAGY